MTDDSNADDIANEALNRIDRVISAECISKLNAESAGKTTGDYGSVGALTQDQLYRMAQQQRAAQTATANQGALMGNGRWTLNEPIPQATTLDGIPLSKDRTLRAECLSTALQCTPSAMSDTQTLIAKAQAFYDFVTGKQPSANLHVVQR